jgi:hypothetical protein
MVFSGRELSHALGLRPEFGYPLLKTGVAEHWIRRNLGDPQLGMALEDVTRKPAEQNMPEDARYREMTVMLAACAIDPFAPLAWRGIAVQPDGVATALVNASPEVAAAIEEVVAAEAVVPYLDARERRPELASQRDDARDFRRLLGTRGPSGGVRRLTYAANPMLACASPLLANHTVVRITDLLPALDAAAATTDRAKPPMDAHIAAFVAARADTGLTGELMALKSFAGPAERLAVLRLFGKLEQRLQPGPLPGLGGWLLQSGFATLEDWRSHKRRGELEETVKRAAAAGQIAAMLHLVDDPGARRDDEAGAASAAARHWTTSRAAKRAAAESRSPWGTSWRRAPGCWACSVPRYRWHCTDGAAGSARTCKGLQDVAARPGVRRAAGLRAGDGVALGGADGAGHGVDGRRPG